MDKFYFSKKLSNGMIEKSVVMRGVMGRGKKMAVMLVLINVS